MSASPRRSARKARRPVSFVPGGDPHLGDFHDGVPKGLLTSPESKPRGPRRRLKPAASTDDPDDDDASVYLKNRTTPTHTRAPGDASVYLKNRTTPTHTRTRRALNDIPYGRSLFPSIASQDKTGALCQGLILALGFAALVLVPLAPTLSVAAGADGGWDAAHGITWNNPLNALGTLLEHGVGIKPAQAKALAGVTAGLFGLLFLVDVAGRLLGAGWPNKTLRVAPALIDWPQSWDTANTRCYDDMFAEPTRPRSLVRRPGNVYSNALYLFGALVVLAGCFTGTHAYHTFWVADAMFGTMLFILALLSVIWHASNAPTSQYIDLWSMDSCIAFLLVRFLALAAAGSKSPKSSPASSPASPIARWSPVATTDAEAESYAAWGCAALFAAVILFNGKLQYASFTQRGLHGACPFSGRKMLRDNPQLGVMGICTFACLPFYYMILPCVLQVAALGSVGSVVAMTVAAGALVVGWTVRMSERFCVDGNIIMNAIRDAQESGHASGALSWLTEPALTAAAAVASPTASLHFFTAITLVLGYCHARTVDAEVLLAWVGVDK